MTIDPSHLRTLVAKLDTLPPEQLAEVEDFVDFIQLRDQDRQMRKAVTRASQSSFEQVWDNPDDAVYDAL